MTAHQAIDEDEFEPAAIPSFDHAAILSHVRLLHGLASMAGAPGKLVLAAFGENPITGRKTLSTVQHFKIGDIDGMVRAIVAFEKHEHANLYAPFAIMRPDLPLGKKGSEADVRCVLALVGDLDSDSGKTGALPLPAPYVIQTSAGNTQPVYPLSPVLAVGEAKPIAEALAAAIGCDPGTKDLAHVWRVPGTLNWPNKEKLRRGRSPEPQAVTVVTPWAGEMVEPEKLKEAVAAHSRPNGKANGHYHARDGAAGDDWQLLWALLPEAIRKLITDPPGANEDRSAVAFTVILSLIARDWSDAKIAAVIRAHPQGIGARYAEGKDLEADIRRAHEKREQSGGNSNQSGGKAAHARSKYSTVGTNT